MICGYICLILIVIHFSYRDFMLLVIVTIALIVTKKWNHMLNLMKLYWNHTSILKSNIIVQLSDCFFTF